MNLMVLQLFHLVRVNNHKKDMFVQLIQDQLNTKESIDVVTEIIHMNIRFHEKKIAESDDIKVIKAHQEQVKHLQKYLFEVRKFVESKATNIDFSATFELQINSK